MSTWRRSAEMCRVAGEARIFPVLDMFDGGRSPHLDGVIGQLRDAGFTAELVRVPYEFQRGGNEMLRVIRRWGSRRLLGGRYGTETSRTIDSVFALVIRTVSPSGR